MIDCLVFSRDRPLQLDGLLDSIAEYAPGLFSSVTVLFYPSSFAFLDAYRECAGDHTSVVFQQEEQSFEDDVRSWLDDAGEYVCFLTDDELFVREAPEPALAIPKEDDVCFAPTLEDPRGRWDWREEAWRGRGDDRIYPLAIHGHIYRTGTITALLDFPFSDPNRLEDGLAGHRKRVGQYMAAPVRQCLVGIPANRVSPSSRCAFDERGHDEWRTEALLAAYQDGARLDRAAMAAELAAAVGVRAEIDLRFLQVEVAC